MAYTDSQIRGFFRTEMNMHHGHLTLEACFDRQLYAIFIVQKYGYTQKAMEVYHANDDINEFIQWKAKELLRKEMNRTVDEICH